MSLGEVILDIAEAMEAEASHWAEGQALRSYATQLRIAVKAAGGNVSPAAAPLVYDEAFNRNMIEQAKRELRASRERGPVEEGPLNPSMAEVADGPMAGAAGEAPNHVPVDPGMPTGATCVVGAHVYELRADRKLWYVPGVTNPAQAKRIVPG